MNESLALAFDVQHITNVQDTANAGGTVAFESLVSAHRAAVMKLCLRLLKDRSAAEDACQETLIAAWRHEADLQDCRSWLLRVATNKCLDELRRRARHNECDIEERTQRLALPAREVSPEAAVLSVETREALMRALCSLPAAQRETLMLSDMHGLAYRDIAIVLGISVGTVKSRVFRARCYLRQVLGGDPLFERLPVLRGGVLRQPTPR